MQQKFAHFRIISNEHTTSLSSEKTPANELAKHGRENYNTAFNAGM